VDGPGESAYMNGNSSPLVLLLAANSALGLEVVRSMLEKGIYRIGVTYRTNGEDLKALFESHNLDSNTYVKQLDLSDESMLRETLGHFSSISSIWGLVNFAGVSSASRLRRLDGDSFNHAVSQNLRPAVNVTLEGLKLMADAGNGGRVIHFSSVTVRRPVPGAVPYIVGKAAIEALVRSSAEEFGKYRITINAVRLGYINSGMALRDVPADLLKDIISRSAVRSLGSPKAIAHLVEYLLSDKAEFQTGSVISLDGALI